MVELFTRMAEAARADPRLMQMTLGELKQIVAARQYDPEKETARWRSQTKFIELIVTHARKQLDEELAQEVPAGASWML